MMGFDVTVVKDAELVTFVEALETFYAKARGADLALFYFAGHARDDLDDALVVVETEPAPAPHSVPRRVIVLPTPEPLYRMLPNGTIVKIIP